MLLGDAKRSTILTRLACFLDNWDNSLRNGDVRSDKEVNRARRVLRRLGVLPCCFVGNLKAKRALESRDKDNFDWKRYCSGSSFHFLPDYCQYLPKTLP